MAQGYRNRPEGEAENLRDGWYRPRGLGRSDDEGSLHILGRAADVRWIAGAMLSPTLVEETLCEMPAVRVAVVVAHNEAGTWIGAVVPWEGVSIDPQACLTTIAEEHGPEAPPPFALIPMSNIPVTHQ